MKKTLSILAAFAAFVAVADVLTLRPGMNTLPPGGKIVAAEAVTANASATVAIKAVATVTAYTNAYASVANPHVCFTFAYTNYNGAASVKTNVLDSLVYADWQTNLVSGGVTSTVSRILGNVVSTTTNITESVLIGRLPSQSYTLTNSLMSISASSHRGTVTNAAYWLTGDLLVTGAGDDDVIRIYVE